MGVDSIGSKPVSAPPTPKQIEDAKPITPGVGQAVIEAKGTGHTGASKFSTDAAPVETKGKSPTEAAQANYAANGDQKYDLSTREGRESLVVQSPQIDNNPNTTNDKIRCGGACLADGVLLDGDHKANAKALQAMKKEAEGRGATYTEDQEKALKALESGKMSPNEAAHLQEFMMTTAKFQPVQPPGSSNQNFEEGRGITSNGMANMVGAINGHGGMKNAGNIEFTGEVRTNDKGGQYNHWTMTSRDQSLYPTHVDPMPDRYGRAPLDHREPDPSPSFVPDPKDPKRMVPNDKFLAQVVLYPKDPSNPKEKESMVDVRTTGIERYINKVNANGYGHTRLHVTPGKPDSLTRDPFVIRDRETHEAQVEVPGE